MKCKYHKDIQSEYVCSVCGNAICTACMNEVMGKKVCDVCVNKNLYGQKNGKNDMNKFLHFIFSLIPGCGQMYMGLMNRGLQILSMFVGIIVVANIIDESILALSIIVWLYSFFDSLNTRKAVLRGEVVEDKYVYNIDKNKINMSEINKKHVGTALVILSGFAIFDNMSHVLIGLIEDVFKRDIPYYMIHNIKDCVIPLILLLVGMKLIKKSKNLKKENEKINVEKPIDTLE